jgi:hypothetical protein
MNPTSRDTRCASPFLSPRRRHGHGHASLFLDREQPESRSSTCLLIFDEVAASAVGAALFWGLLPLLSLPHLRGPIDRGGSVPAAPCHSQLVLCSATMSARASSQRPVSSGTLPAQGRTATGKERGGRSGGARPSKGGGGGAGSTTREERNRASPQWKRRLAVRGASIVTQAYQLNRAPNLPSLDASPSSERGPRGLSPRP